MVNYYVELQLDRSMSIAELEKQLKQLKRTWTSRASNASSTEKRQEAERKVELIREASATLLNKDNKAKYDKDLDKDPAASAQAAPQQEVIIPQGDFTTGAAMLDLVEQFYDAGNYNQAIAVANKAFETGNYSVDLFRLVALCYIERGDNGSAFRYLNTMKSKYPSDNNALYVYAHLCIRLIPEHAADGHKCIVQLIENGYDDDRDIAALDAEYSLIVGDEALADQKVKNFLSKHGNDMVFREKMCDAYTRYADKFLTSYGGDMYFDSQENCDKWFNTVDHALKLYNDPETKKLRDDNKAIVGGRKLLTDNVLGIFCAIFYTIAGFAASPLVGIVLLALTVAEIYYSIVPKWMLHRYNYTQKLVGIYEVFRIINYIFAFLVKIGWEITKFIFRLIFSFI